MALSSRKWCTCIVHVFRFQQWLKSENESFSHLIVSDSLQPHGLQLARLLCPWNSSGKNTRVGSHSLLQGIFSTGIESESPACQADSLAAEPPEKPWQWLRYTWKKWKLLTPKSPSFFLTVASIALICLFCDKCSWEGQQLKPPNPGASESIIDFPEATRVFCEC